MQGINSKRFKYIIITEHIGFIPDNILNNCKTIHVPKPSITNYNKCFIKNNEYDGLKVKNNTLHVSYISENSIIEKNMYKHIHMHVLLFLHYLQYAFAKLCALR